MGTDTVPDSMVFSHEIGSNFFNKFKLQFMSFIQKQFSMLQIFMYDDIRETKPTF